MVRGTAVIVIVSVSVVSFSLPAGGSGGSGLHGKSAKQVWALAVAAVESKGSVHMVEKPFLCCGATNVFGKNGELVTDDGQSEGSQTVSSGGMYGQGHQWHSTGKSPEFPVRHRSILLAHAENAT